MHLTLRSVAMITGLFFSMFLSETAILFAFSVNDAKDTFLLLSVKPILSGYFFAVFSRYNIKCLNYEMGKKIVR